MGTIAVDSSALLAILLFENEAQTMINCMENADTLCLSAVNYMEAGIVFDQRPLAYKQGELDALIASFRINILSVDPNQAKEARQAYRRFGKGNHPAKLNLGDCFAYALAKTLHAPLLFKGNDFIKTDIASAL